jgi:hypothetical protein
MRFEMFLFFRACSLLPCPSKEQRIFCDATSTTSHRFAKTFHTSTPKRPELRVTQKDKELETKQETVENTLRNAETR